MPRTTKSPRNRLVHRLVNRLKKRIKTDAAPGFIKSRARKTGDYYHIVLRGNRRDALISTVDDRRALNHIAIDALRRFNATLHGYCLMTNQLRALVQIDEKLLVKALRMIVTRYSIHRRRHSTSTASIFERPYEAQRIDSGSEFLNLLRFIHLTPVLANAVVEPVDYRWSSHRAYVGYKSVAWITTDFGLSLLSTDPTQARAAYHQFMAEVPPPDAITPDTMTTNTLPNANSIHDSVDRVPAESKTASIAKTRSKLRIIRTHTIAKLVRSRKRQASSRFISIY